MGGRRDDCKKIRFFLTGSLECDIGVPRICFEYFQNIFDPSYPVMGVNKRRFPDR